MFLGTYPLQNAFRVLLCLSAFQKGLHKLFDKIFCKTGARSRIKALLFLSLDFFTEVWLVKLFYFQVGLAGRLIQRLYQIQDSKVIVEEKKEK